jgi:hypothetical protein
VVSFVFAPKRGVVGAAALLPQKTSRTTVVVAVLSRAVLIVFVLSSTELYSATPSATVSPLSALDVVGRIKVVIVVVVDVARRSWY